MIVTEQQLEKIIKFIEDTSNKFNIDSGHGLDHSQKILYYCSQLVPYYELNNNQLFTIEVAALLHDMCDKKYMNESDGIIRIEDFLKDELDVEKLVIGDIETIILNMSYSKVVKQGHPDFTYMKHLEVPYHIVRNADLLCAYQLERCMEYQKRSGGNRKECLEKMFDIYSNRVAKQILDGHINLEPAIKIARELEEKCKKEYEVYQNEYRDLMTRLGIDSRASRIN